MKDSDAGSRSSRNVLMFLGACLAFTESLIGFVVVRSADPPSGGWALAVGLVALLLVLLALIVMYWRNPAFLVAQREQLLLLEFLQSISALKDPELLRSMILQMDLNTLLSGGLVAPTDKQEPREKLQEERTTLEQELEALRRPEQADEDKP